MSKKNTSSPKPSENPKNINNNNSGKIQGQMPTMENPPPPPKKK